MASKKASNPLNGMHTAGIFSDMSVDGPEIGTLVLIIDRAKNLPNRKTIGKQDPYCAARLGKEAKKTTTDIRGGQTPKWDQELRFTVHDSPDYYQLKISVFNDDKKTELIGETWIDLRDVVVPGGGQNDQWQGLNCKGKYAGEIRIEITYYDSRPKLEKAAAKPKPVSSTSELEGGQGGTIGPRAMKRRPLPSDPVTGQPPAQPAPAPVLSPASMQTPPRAQPNPPTSFIPKQSPLQAVEYNTPPPPNHHDPYDQYHPHAPGNQYPANSARVDPQQPRHYDRNEKYPAYEEDHSYDQDPYGQSYEPEPRTPYHQSQQHDYESPSPPAPYMQQDLRDDRPPPPPAHRSRNSGNSHDLMSRASFDPLQHKGAPLMRHDVLRNEAHRSSVPAPSSSSYPGRPTYRPYESAPTIQNALPYQNGEADQPSPPRHHSYDSAYASHRSMQPTVEDVPESWTPPDTRPRGNSRQSRYDEMDRQAHSPAPLNLGGRNSAGPGYYSPGGMPSQRPYDSGNYESPVSPMAPRKLSSGVPGVVSPSSYSHQGQPRGVYANELDNTQAYGSNNNMLPPVPSTLVTGIDPSLAMEVAHQFHEDRRHQRRYTQPPPGSNPSRGRQQSEPPINYGGQPSSYGHHANHSMNYDSSPAAFSSGPNTPSGQAPGSRTRGLSPSPNPNHTIKRKSVSPSPVPTPETLRLSGIPFGPDSYDALNPSLASSKESNSKSSEYTNSDGKIVTPDGREVDPSDHLPMDTWAPEPEPKLPKGGPSPDSRTRPAPAGAQPMPPSGRRPLRVSAARPQSMAAAPNPAYITPDVDPSPPPSSGRNRLQKKAHRASAVPAPISAGSSPLGPATSHQRNSTPPRSLVRASTFDYENHGPPYGSSPSGGRMSYGSAPPVPAKIPLMSGGLVGAGPSGSGSRGPGGDNSWALMEEMSRIDIGTGRARRHGGY